MAGVVIGLLMLLWAPRAFAEERTSWRYDKGSFEKTADGGWVEKAADGTYQFQEKERTDEYVELYDSSRKITVRLSANDCLVKVGDRGRFKRTYTGSWGASAGTKPEPKGTTPDPKKPAPTTPRDPAPAAKTDAPFTEVAAIPDRGNLNLYNFGVAVSPDGDFIAVGLGTALQPELGIVEVATKKVTKRWPMPVLAQPLVWSDDGSTLAASILGKPRPDGRKSQIVLWDTKTWEQRAAFDHPGFPGALALSREGNVVAAAGGSSGEPGSLRVWDVAAGKMIFSADVSGGSPHLGLSANGKVLAVDGLSPNIVVLDLPGGKQRRVVPGLGTFALSADGTSLIVWGYGKDGLQVAVWDVRGAPQAGRVIKGEKWKPDSLALIDEGRHVVLGGGIKQDEVRVYELRSGKLAYTFPVGKAGPGRRMLLVRPVPDSSRLLTLGTDGVTRLWTTPFGEKREAPDPKPAKDP
jgi:WD40 repeat protein